MEEQENKAEAIDIAISKLEIKDGDVLLIHVPPGARSELVKRMFMEISSSLKILGYRDVLVMIIDEGVDIQTLDEESLNQLGLVKGARVDQLLH